MPDDYETPKIPPSTPPAIAPDTDAGEASRAPIDGDDEADGSVTAPPVDPRNGRVSSAELAADGEREGEVLKGHTGDSEIESEMPDELTRRAHRDGAGEAELDRMPPD